RAVIKKTHRQKPAPPRVRPPLNITTRIFIAKRPYLASTNKCLAQSNKSQDAAKTTKRCEVRLQQGSVAMLDRHITRRMILAPIAGIGALLLSGGAPAFAFNGPSFDCSHGVNSALAIILCNAPDAAQADWDLVSAYWAFSTDDRDQRAFSESMNQRCALPWRETAEESVGRAFAQGLGRTMWGQPLPIP